MRSSFASCCDCFTLCSVHPQASICHASRRRLHVERRSRWVWHGSVVIKLSAPKVFRLHKRPFSQSWSSSGFVLMCRSVYPGYRVASSKELHVCLCFFITDKYAADELLLAPCDSIASAGQYVNNSLWMLCLERMMHGHQIIHVRLPRLCVLQTDSNS